MLFTYFILQTEGIKIGCSDNCTSIAEIVNPVGARIRDGLMEKTFLGSLLKLESARLSLIGDTLQTISSPVQSAKVSILPYELVDIPAGIFEGYVKWSDELWDWKRGIYEPVWKYLDAIYPADYRAEQLVDKREFGKKLIQCDILVQIGAIEETPYVDHHRSHLEDERKRRLKGFDEEIAEYLGEKPNTSQKGITAENSIIKANSLLLTREEPKMTDETRMTDSAENIGDDTGVVDYSRYLNFLSNSSTEDTISIQVVATPLPYTPLQNILPFKGNTNTSIMRNLPSFSSLSTAASETANRAVDSVFQFLQGNSDKKLRDVMDQMAQGIGITGVGVMTDKIADQVVTVADKIGSGMNLTKPLDLVVSTANNTAGNFISSVADSSNIGELVDTLIFGVKDDFLRTNNERKLNEVTLLDPNAVDQELKELAMKVVEKLEVDIGFLPFVVTLLAKNEILGPLSVNDELLRQFLNNSNISRCPPEIPELLLHPERLGLEPILEYSLREKRPGSPLIDQINKHSRIRQRDRDMY